MANSKNKILKQKTVVLVTIAFLAGLMANNVITNAYASKINNTTQNYKVMTSENNQQQTQSKTKDNIPPKKGFREYISTEQKTINGIDYIVTSKYRVKEYAFLMEQTHTNKNTKKVEEIAKYKNYEIFPKSSDIRKGNGDLVYKSEFTDIDSDYNMPKKAVISKGMTDGSILTDHVTYSISVKSTTSKPKVHYIELIPVDNNKPSNNNNTKKSNDTKKTDKETEEEEFKEWIDFMNRIGI